MRRKPLLPETAVAILFICCAFYFFLNGDKTEKSVNAALSAAAILLFHLSYSRKAKLATRLIFTGWFIMATLFGVILDFYALLPWYDSLVHLVTGACLVYLAKGGMRLEDKAARRAKVLYAFFFSVSLSTFWEIYEFGVDFLGADSQHGSLSDTMWDLIYGTIGAAAAGIALYHLSGKILKSDGPEQRKRSGN
ncbi:ABC-type uncharacterized transport system permease subunit [Youngiibacter multivorans]|uniref:ABC-type uncharacterized transport system permease subunit n=2 Tax=Youngiibacter multivorans TaxID=937251 RepID=A0ABS4G4A8_9CLOT|nr:ABC-type uncharacterized transport system permease subunit [Youngiibacter multivorans]